MQKKLQVATVVFVKTPGLSPLKTRLAKAIGKEKAQAFFIESVKQTENTLKEFQATGDVDCYWSVAEEKALEHPMWQGLPRFLQVSGGLGDRMHGAYEKLREEYHFVILLGADCPHMPLEYLTKAKAALLAGDYKHVLGPTEDGGFYLFASGTEFSLKQWNRTEYSMENTRNEFVQHMGLAKGECWMLPELFDVDELEDFERLQSL